MTMMMIMIMMMITMLKMKSVEQWMEGELAREAEEQGENLAQFHFVNHTPPHNL
jgi:hypothetical protein